MQVEQIFDLVNVTSRGREAWCQSSTVSSLRGADPLLDHIDWDRVMFSIVGVIQDSARKGFMITYSVTNSIAVVEVREPLYFVCNQRYA